VSDLTCSYRRQELGFRTSIYISAASASGAFGGLLAIGLSKIPPSGALNTWRWIFFCEGFITLVIAGLAFWFIPAGPEAAKFLTEEEKIVAVDRLRVDSAGTSEGQSTKFKHVWQALGSVHVLGCGLGFFFGK
jgi:MFS family permease